MQRLITAAGTAGDSRLASPPHCPAANEHAGQALADVTQQGCVPQEVPG